MSNNKTIRRLVILGTVALLIFIPVSHFIGWGTLFDAKKRHFWRALGFPCPKDVQVVHSLYHRGETSFEDDNYFYLELMPSASSSILKTLITDKDLVREVILGEIPEPVISALAADHSDDPKWFAPGPRDSYEVWITRDHYATGIEVLRSKDGRIFIVGEIYRM